MFLKWIKPTKEEVGMLNENRVCTGPDDPGPCIVADGGRVRISVTAMDACQCSEPMLTDAQRNQLAAAKAEAAKVQRWADHYAGVKDGEEQIEREADTNGQRGYEHRLNNAWRTNGAHHE